MSVARPVAKLRGSLAFCSASAVAFARFWGGWLLRFFSAVLLLLLLKLQPLP